MPDMETPDPYKWITRDGASEVLGVNVRTVSRMIADGRLTAYWPNGGEHERRPILLWYDEVKELRAARVRAGMQEARDGAFVDD
jgi:excisionase family DNA binding protein